MKVAVLTYSELPKFVTWEIPDPEPLIADDRMVMEALGRRGVQAEPVVWRDPAVDWSRYDAALIRSTWDYIDYPEEFLAALARIDASSCRLFNPLEAVRWNVDKKYMLDLQSWGTPVVPTHLATEHGLQDRAVEQGWTGAVLKGRVGAGASEVHKLGVEEIDSRLAELREQGKFDRFLLQPFVESIVTEGEYSFFFIGGELSHILHKKAAAGEYRAHSLYGGTNEIVERPETDEQQARQILSKVPFDLLYARLDLVRIDGRLAVMEVELIEPVLYYAMAPEKVEMLVSATLARFSSTA